jgi:hypothetical protein
MRDGYVYIMASPSRTIYIGVTWPRIGMSDFLATKARDHAWSRPCDPSFLGMTVIVTVAGIEWIEPSIPNESRVQQ